MKRLLFAAFLSVFAVVVTAQAQTPTPSPFFEPRQRSISPEAEPRSTPVPARTYPSAPRPSPAEPGVSPSVVGTEPEGEDSVEPVAGPAATERRVEPIASAARLMSPMVIQTRIGEAERFLKSRPMQTAMMPPSLTYVTLAAIDRDTSRVHLVTVAKETFLKKGSEVTMTSSLGMPLNVRILRANGVNTAVAIFDLQGRSLAPLVVEFPIEKRGIFREMAYYTSAHPALLSPELTRSGRAYVHRMIELAAKRLRERGTFISPQVLDIAERLCLVEHVDHDRFRRENRLALFDEIYSLYALNELDTYRYSVSSAGAGGMVQMIPWAYNLMKQRHPGVGLTPDFVAGMRNHANALQAMLLYMQDTWNDLAANEDVQYALQAKLATQPELLAAGYNSNAARLPGYIRRGGSAWRTLIPRETQMYLQIYKNLEAVLPRKKPGPAD
ncbi:MAG TPA: hypothetical protein VNO50_08975 [Pyrinomonadaceae bacterium]|nr:hypothetical protein [Pyrinomonadaceae bacterium]